MMTLAQALSAALVHFLWQGAIVALLLAVVLPLLRHQSADARYIASCVAMAALLILPIVTTALFYLQPLPADAPAASTTTTQATVAVITIAAFGTPSEIQRTGWFVSLQSWALPIWSVGVLLFSLRLVLAGRHAVALSRSGEPSDDRIVDTVARLAARIGVARPIRVLIGALGDGPSVIGWLRPAILLPPAAAMGLTSQQLEMILAHEIAHIRRHDYLVNLLQLLVETILFYHPAVWWTSNQIRRERELCCDDVAVGACGDAATYARALTTLERVRVDVPSVVMAGTGGPLLYRIQRLLGATTLDATPSRWPGVLAMCLAATCVAINMAWLRAQTTAEASRPSFEIASIKPNVSGRTFLDRDGIARPSGSVRFWPGGRFTATNMSLRGLVETAYHITQNRGYVTGGPDWVESARFDIDAKPLDGVISPTIDRESIDKSKLMLQQLLEDRFALRVRREAKQLPIYELVVAKGGPKLSKPAPRDCSMPSTYCQGFVGGSGLGIDGHMISMLDLSEFLTVVGDRPVRDKTGVKGIYDVKTTGWTDPNRRPPSDSGNQNREEVFDPSGPSLFTVLEEQLGLRLEPSKGPVETVVVDRAERPTED